MSLFGLKEGDKSRLKRLVAPVTALIAIALAGLVGYKCGQLWNANRQTDVETKAFSSSNEPKGNKMTKNAVRDDCETESKEESETVSDCGSSPSDADLKLSVENSGSPPDFKNEPAFQNETALKQNMRLGKVLVFDRESREWTEREIVDCRENSDGTVGYHCVQKIRIRDDPNTSDEEIDAAVTNFNNKSIESKGNQMVTYGEALWFSTESMLVRPFDKVMRDCNSRRLEYGDVVAVWSRKKVAWEKGTVEDVKNGYSFINCSQPRWIMNTSCLVQCL